MKRHFGYSLLIATALAGAGISVTASAKQSAARAASGTFDVVEKSIPKLGAALRAGTVTSQELVKAYLARIEAYDHQGPALNAIITLNPKASADAEALDRERATRGPRGPLHGIPIILKDNYDTGDMPTT